jgi:D-proline reductase (dithiol) PrdB
MTARDIDSYKFLDPVTKRIMKAWAARERFEDIPWTPLRRPLGECRVALLSSAAIALVGDRPFDQQGERENPWWGDPTHRVLPAGARTGDVALYHLHIDTRPAERDLNCVLPLERLAELAAAGAIGEVAPSHYSMMGYILDEAELLVRTAPQIAARLRQEAVDALLLVPV